MSLRRVGECASTLAIELRDEVVLGALQFRLEYSRAGAEPVGGGEGVFCFSPLSAQGASALFNKDEGTATVVMSAIAVGGFSGPATVAVCLLTSRS